MAEVAFEDVFVDYAEVLCVRKPFAQIGGESAVDFYGDGVSCFLDECFRQQSSSGADLDGEIVFCQAGCLDELSADVAVDQKVLPEFLIEV